MRIKYSSVLLLFAIAFLVACSSDQESKSNFIKVNGHQFIKNGKPYNYVGTNYWYGANLAADTIGGDRIRLLKELDFLKSAGIDNLRVLVGAEGADGEPFRVSPTTIKHPGVYSETMLKGLDFLLNEMKKRDMVAILYLTNNWEWSGGVAQYLEWNGYGEYVNPNLEKFSWDEFFSYQKQFYSCNECMQQLNQYITHIVTRKNTISGTAYVDDPAIMAWELANEPRPMANDNFEPFEQWIKSTAELIRSLDKNHLITTGNEGEKGCSDSISLFEQIHSLPQIDYLTIHIWMKNWSWYDYNNADSTFPVALQLVDKYIDDHYAIAEKLNKPLVIEEFGVGRNGELSDPSASVSIRDRYYDNVFSKVAESVAKGGYLVGANFWTFGGFVSPTPGQTYWKSGDAYMGDPPQEPQGLNSVFPQDSSTMNIIIKYNKQFNRIP